MTSEDGESKRCALSKRLHDRTTPASGEEDEEGRVTHAIKFILWKCVWNYMLPKQYQKQSTPVDSLGSSWILASSAFTGCLETTHYLIHSLLGQSLKVSTETQTPSVPTIAQYVNQRTACEFPLPDTWVNQCVLLAVNPLHLACWRLDLRMVQTLLRLGADPNSLALETCKHLSDTSETETTSGSCESEMEQNDTIVKNAELVGNQFAPRKSNPVEESGTESKGVTVDGIYFHSDYGLSPLDFVVLGLRCPPTNSLELASEYDVMHNTTDMFPRSKVDDDDPWESRCGNTHCPICPCFGLQDERKHETNSRNTDDDYADRTEELLIKCLDLLISVGANPNQGKAKVLEFWYPLDVLIQPPISLFYGPMMGRSSQIAVNIRRFNLGHNIFYVTSGCRTLISHNAHLSSSFLSLLKWKPRFLDCFAIDSSEESVELIKMVTRLGLFQDDYNYYHCDYTVPNTNAQNFLENGLDGIEALKKHPMHNRMKTFIADVVNNEISHDLVLKVLQNVSIPTIHLFYQLATEVIRSSEFDQTFLSGLVQEVMKGQMRTLTHSAMLIILCSINSRQRESVEALPLPNSLKRRLLSVDF